MTAVQDTHEAAAEAGPGGRQVSRHRAAGSAYTADRVTQQGQLTALAVVPCTAAALVGVLAVAVLTHAAHAPLLQGKALAAVVVLGAVLVALIIAGYVWAAHIAQVADSAVAEQVEAERRPDAESAAPAASAQPEISESEVYVHLSHRLQSLVHRQIGKIDNLEGLVEDPDLLAVLFEVDHLATRIRRHAENLAVLGGALPHRQWDKPVSVVEVLRSAASETLGYRRVQFFARGAGDLNGYALADVVHLLAELVENATSFSPGEMKVTMRAQSVPAGLAIEIDDRGFGLEPQEYAKLNALLQAPAGIDVHQLLREAHIGLYVVAQLALRHGIVVRLQEGITGGTQALVVLPNALLATTPATESASADAQAAVESGLWVAPGIGAGAPNPGIAANTDGAQDSGFAPTSAQFASFPGGALPAPRRAADGQRLSTTTGTHSAASGHQSPQGSAAAPNPHAQVGAEQTGVARPLLPHRRPQQHLAAPLAEGPTNPAERVSDRGFTPGLMADFTLGRAQSSGQPSPQDHSDEHAPTQEGR